jgi:sn-glycerol 3-phosphate transport system substrate-binding protein
MGGALGEAVNDIAAALQRKPERLQDHAGLQGHYEETLTATIAAFRAGEQPNIVQVFDAGAATIIGAEGATVIPAEDLLGRATASTSTATTTSRRALLLCRRKRQDGRHAVQLLDADLYYNVEALEKPPVSTPPKTWEEFQTVTAPALKEAGYIPLAQSHLPWIFTENFMSRHNLPFATNANGYGAGGTEILVETRPSRPLHRHEGAGTTPASSAGTAPAGTTTRSRSKKAKSACGSARRARSAVFRRPQPCSRPPSCPTGKV